MLLQGHFAQGLLALHVLGVLLEGPERLLEQFFEVVHAHEDFVRVDGFVSWTLSALRAARAPFLRLGLERKTRQFARGLHHLQVAVDGLVAKGVVVVVSLCLVPLELDDCTEKR